MEKVKELLDYSLNGMKFSLEEFTAKLITLLIKEYHLEPYIRFLGFKTKSLLSIWNIYSISAYDMVNNSICVFKNDYNKVLEDNIERFKIPIRDINKYSYYLITQIMLHEIEHAKQKKMIMEGENNHDIENMIINLALRHIYQKYPNTLTTEAINDYIDVMDIVQNAFYNYSPTERLAEIHSYNNIENIIEEESIKKIFQNEKEKRLLRGYKEDICPPTIYFFRQLDRSDRLKTDCNFKNYKSYISCLQELSFYDENESVMIAKAIRDYDLDKRLLYCLPISNNEYLSLTKK